MLHLTDGSDRPGPSPGSPRARLLRALLAAVANGVASAVPLGRLPRGPVVAVGAVAGGVTVGTSLFIASRRSQETATPVRESGADREWPQVLRAEVPRSKRLLATGAAMGAGATIGAGTLWFSAITDRWMEDALHRRGSEHPRVWIAAGSGVLGGVLEWVGQRQPQR